MDTQLTSYDGKLKELEDKLQSDLLGLKTKQNTQIESKNKKFDMKMAAVEKKEDTLK